MQSPHRASQLQGLKHPDFANHAHARRSSRILRQRGRRGRTCRRLPMRRRAARSAARLGPGNGCGRTRRLDRPITSSGAKEIARLLDSHRPRTVENTLRPYDQAQAELLFAAYQTELMSRVHPDKAMRDKANELTQVAQSAVVELSLNPAVYRALAADRPIPRRRRDSPLRRAHAARIPAGRRRPRRCDARTRAATRGPRDGTGARVQPQRQRKREQGHGAQQRRARRPARRLTSPGIRPARTARSR